MKVGELLATEGRQGFLRKYGDWVLLITVVVVVLGLLVFIDFRSTGRWQPFASIQQGITIVGRKIDNSINNQQRIRVLTERYDSLYRSVNVDVQLQRDLDRLLLENNRLRQVLGISEEIAYNNVVGEVIGRNPNDTYSFTINQGRERGIRVDLPVVTIQDDKIALVGRVIAASQTSSVIDTIVTPREQLLGKHSRSQLSGIIRGSARSGQILSMNITDDRDAGLLRVGDTVVTSHLSSVFPADILIGQISAVSGLNHDNNFLIEIVPTINFNRLEYVFVLIPEGVI